MFIYTGENTGNYWCHALYPSDLAKDHAHHLIKNHRCRSLSSVAMRTGAAEMRIVVWSRGNLPVSHLDYAIIFYIYLRYSL